MSDNLKHRFSSFTIIVIFVVLILSGIPLVYLINIEINPNAKSSSLSISFSWSGTEPRIIEKQVTSKLEALIARVQGVKNINSTSGNGSGNIYITLDKQANTDAVRFEISTLIRQVWPELPAGVGYPQLTMNRPNQDNERPLLSYTLNSLANPHLVQKFADDNIKPALSQIPGIYKIEIYGAAPMEWVIEYDVEKLKAHGISQQEIKQAVNTGLEKGKPGSWQHYIPGYSFWSGNRFGEFISGVWTEL